MSMFEICISKYMFYIGVHIRNKWQLTTIKKWEKKIFNVSFSDITIYFFSLQYRVI